MAESILYLNKREECRNSGRFLSVLDAIATLSRSRDLRPWYPKSHTSSSHLWQRDSQPSFRRASARKSPDWSRPNEFTPKQAPLAGPTGIAQTRPRVLLVVVPQPLKLAGAQQRNEGMNRFWGFPLKETTIGDG